MNIDQKIRCIQCNHSNFLQSSTLWMCQHCNTTYQCQHGIPTLLNEAQVSERDLTLRNKFYDNALGKFYQKLMPFLTLPARPVSVAKKDWLFYFISLSLFITSLVVLINVGLHANDFAGPVHPYLTIQSIAVVLIAAGVFIKHPYLFYLYLLAIPTKVSLLKSNFKPAPTFRQTHDELIAGLRKNNAAPLHILDISTGTGNSLYRHGWMTLAATYTGLDLSATMLAQCQQFFAGKNIPLDLVIGDATTLPFADEYFDVVLNYGAINGYGDIQKALAEMARVTKPGGLMLFLDEQLYPAASYVEKLYFQKVLSSHNTIHQCPTALLPGNVTQVQVRQIYEFYYLCTCVKS